MEITYVCRKCWSHYDNPKNMLCPECGGELRGIGCPGITGTRDSFGVGKAFIDEKSGEVIDNWSKWEKAGYQKVEKTKFKNDAVREAFEKRTNELKGEKLKQLSPNEMPV